MDGLKLLLWKNWKIQSRNKIESLVEIITPLVVAFCALSIRLGTDLTKITEPTEYPPFHVKGNPPHIVRSLCNTLYYAPSHSLTDSIMEQINEDIFKKDGLNYKFQGFQNERELIKAYKASVIGLSGAGNESTSPVLAGVVFQNLKAGAGFPKHIKYAIKMPGIQRTDYDDGVKERMNFVPSWYEDVHYYAMEVSGPRSRKNPYGGFPGYFEEGFLYIQYAVESTVGKNLLSPSQREEFEIFDFQLKRFPFPAYNEEYTLMFIQLILGFVTCSGYVYPLMCITKSIIHEKSSRLKEFMKIMGLPNWVHWTSWFIKCLINLSISSALIVALLKISFGDSAVYHYSDSLLLFIIFTCQSVAVIAYAFLFSVLFSGEESGAMAAGFSFFTIYIFWLPLNFKMRESSYAKKLVSALTIPMTGLNVGLAWVDVKEIQRVGVQWDNIWDPVLDKNEFSFADCCWTLLVNAFVTMLAAFYIEAVFPGDFGVPLPWYFPFTKWYWTGEVRGNDNDNEQQGRISNLRPELESSKSKSQSNENVEMAPPNLKAGIDIRNLTKTFGPKIAVNNLSVALYENQVTSVLGCNGAGKTTTMSIITGLIRPTSGTAFIHSMDIRNDMKHIRGSLGFCPQYNVLFEEMTVAEHLTFYCKLKGYGKAETHGEINRMLSILNLEDKRDAQVKTLSGGMKRKLCVGIAFSAGNKVVLLDEPTAGMDIEARRSTWDLIQAEKANRTVLLSTHYMEEADILGDRILVVADGKLQACGSSLFLKNRYGGDYNLVIVKSPEVNILGIQKVVEKIIPSSIFHANVGAELKFTLPASEIQKYPTLFDMLDEKNKELGIESYGVSSTTLEEIFIKIGTSALNKKPGKSTSMPPPYNALNYNQNDLKSSRLSSSYSSAESVHDLGYGNFNSTVSLNRSDNFKNNGGYNGTGPGAIRLEENSKSSVLLKQLWVLLEKKLLVTVRSRELTLLQIIVPIVITAISLTQMKFFPGTFEREAKLFDHTDSYILEDSPMPFYCTSEERLCNKFAQFSHVESRIKVERINGSLDDFTLEKAKKDTGAFYAKYMVGLRVQMVGKNTLIPGIRNSTEIVAYFNNQPFHTPAILLNFLSNSLLHYFCAESRISVSNAPFDMTVLDDSKMKTEYMGVGPMTGSCIGFGLSFLFAGFVIYPMKERACKSRHLQVMYGANTVMLWLSNFLVDLVTCTIGVSGSVIAIAIDNKEEYSSAQVLFVIFVLLMGFGVTGMCVCMFLSLIFDKPSTTYCRIVFIQGCGGVLGTTMFCIISSPDIFKIDDFAHTYRDIMNYLPGFAVVDGFQQIANMHRLHQSCEHLNLKLLCAERPDAACCHLYQKSYFSWKGEGIGKKLVAMTIVSVVSLVLLVLQEMNMFKKLRRQLYRSSYFPCASDTSQKILTGTHIPMESVDEDVTAENKRITQSNISTLCQTEPMIVRNLCKVYKGNFVAVDNLNFGVKRGEIFGMLGVNGAGKTTTFKMLTGDISITSGDAFIDSCSVKNDLKNAHSHIGYCPQFDACLEELTGRETLTMFAKIKGIPEAQIPKMIENIAECFLFTPFLDKRFGACSGGNKRKVSTALAVIGGPSLAFLDEPTAGMDPEARRNIWDAISQVRNSGTSVVLTSHLMEECEALCSRLGVMVRGRFRCLGSPQHLKNKLGEGFTIVAKIPWSATSSVTNGNRHPIDGVHLQLQNRDQTDSNSNSWEDILKRFDIFLSQHFPGCTLKDAHIGFVQYQIPAASPSPNQNPDPDPDPNKSSDSKPTPASSFSSSTPWSKIFRVMEEAKTIFKIESYSVGQVDLENVFFNCIRTQD